MPNLVNGARTSLEVRTASTETGSRSASTPSDVTPRTHDAPAERTTPDTPDEDGVEVDTDPATGTTTVGFLVAVTIGEDVAVTPVWLDRYAYDDDTLVNIVATSIAPAGEAGFTSRRSRVGLYR